MNWRDAFIRQARSDEKVRGYLNASGIEYSHQLHYLQMITEKVAKAYLAHPSGTIQPKAVHQAFVRFLQILPNQSNLRRKLGITNKVAFRKFVQSLLDLAREIELLAPSATGSGRPNAEYPWKDLKSGNVIAPVDYAFPLFAVESQRMIRLDKLIWRLLEIFE